MYSWTTGELKGGIIVNKAFYHIIYKSSNRNKVRDKFGIMYFENRNTMQIRSCD